MESIRKKKQVFKINIIILIINLLMIRGPMLIISGS